MLRVIAVDKCFLQFRDGPGPPRLWHFQFDNKMLAIVGTDFPPHFHLDRWRHSAGKRSFFAAVRTIVVRMYSGERVLRSIRSHDPRPPPSPTPERRRVQNKTETKKSDVSPPYILNFSLHHGIACLLYYAIMPACNEEMNRVRCTTFIFVSYSMIDIFYEIWYTTLVFIRIQETAYSQGASKSSFSMLPLPNLFFSSNFTLSINLQSTSFRTFLSPSPPSVFVGSLISTSAHEIDR